MRQAHASRPAASRRLRTGTAPRLSAAAVLNELDEVSEPLADTGWTVGYLDVMLLLLTLFAALLGINYLRAESPHQELANRVDLIATLPVMPPTPRAVEPEVILAAFQTLVPQSRARTPEPEPAKPAQTKAMAPVAQSAEIKPVPLPNPVIPPFVMGPMPGLLADTAQPGLELFVDGQRLRVEMQHEILFPLGSAVLGEQGKALLQRLIGGLASKDIEISVEGHSDDLPIATERFPSNWELSSYRATTVARYLITLGVPSERLSVSGYSDTRPRALNDTPENRARNRRVTLVLHPKALPARTMGVADESVWRRL